ncbi:MAG: hypothetical protein HQK51_03295 [Oligoflexia bacterium]|nr:hypothetical protein [Oligoflexia bacterium]
MADSKIESLVKEGRKFLHDISNKVLISSGLGSHVLSAVKKGKPIDEKMVDKLERSMNALNLIADMIREYRSYLIALAEESTGSGSGSGGETSVSNTVAATVTTTATTIAPPAPPTPPTTITATPMMAPTPPKPKSDSGTGTPSGTPPSGTPSSSAA